MNAAELFQWPATTLDVALRKWWQRLPEPRPATLAVAFSGGSDSTAVLLAALRLQRGVNGLAADPPNKPPQKIIALHIHHGLQAAADDFAAHCQKICAQLNVPYHAQHLQLECAGGDSVEAVARTARYQALAQMAQQHDAKMVLLGHHANDQAESVLLALSRGAGMAGLAGMPRSFIRHDTAFARPFIHLDQQTLKNWLIEHQVPWLEDPTNTNPQFTRNRLRHAVLPLLEEKLPGFGNSLIRSARLAAQADGLLQDLAAIDLQTTGNPPHIKPLQQLSPERQANLLRHWLKTTHSVIGSESQILALLQVVAACTTRGHSIHIKVGNGYVERDHDVLVWKSLT